MPINPEKHKAFKRISVGRVHDIKEKFRLLTNLASNNYDFTAAEVNDLFTEIERHLNFAKTAFNNRLKKT